jgi:hypothetical protein
MMDYNATQKFLTEQNLHVFTFYEKAGKPVEALIDHLPGITSAEDTVALQEIDYDVVSAKQMTAKRPTPEGAVAHTSLPLFLFTLARNQKHKKFLN